MSYDDVVIPSRRLALLRLLSEMGGQANESVIRDALRALDFVGRTLGDTREDIRFLADRDLVGVSYYADSLMKARLTARGEAYLNREIEPIAGIKYPGIGR